MEPAPTPEAPQPQTDAGAAANDPGLLENAQQVWHDVRGLVGDQLHLAALETQRAGKSLVSMVVYGVGAALLMVSAWLGLMAAAALWMISAGLNPALAVLIAVAVNIGGAGALVLLIKRASSHLGFPATVRSLKANVSIFNPAEPK